MFSKQLKYCPLLVVLLLFNLESTAQLYPLLNMTFGEASADDSTIAGSPLPTGYTEIPYSPQVCPPPGQYSIVTGINANCYPYNIPIILNADNTPNDNNGYMMLLNDVATQNNRTIFQSAVETCEGVNYEFSACFINLDKPSSENCTRFSSFTLQVFDQTGNTIARASSGDIFFAVYDMGYHFTKCKINFTGPLTPGGVVVKVVDEAKALSVCSNAVGIDDIKVIATSATVNIGFENSPVGYAVKNSCFQDNALFSMYGMVESDFRDPLVQWQESSYEGRTWTDIPGATSYNYSRHFPVAGTFLFRLRAADTAHILFPNCNSISDFLKVQVDGIPALHEAVSDTAVCAGQTVQFNAEGGVSFIWSGPNGFYDTIKSPAIDNSSLNDGGWYHVIIKTAGGCVVNDSTYVLVREGNTKAWPDTSICIGQSVVLTANEGIAYSWIPLAAIANSTTRQIKVSPIVTTIYTVKITDKYGCTGTAPVRVKVKNEVKLIAKIAASKYVCRMADSISFIDVSTGIINSWKWDFGNGKISSQHKPPLQVYNNIPSGIDAYTIHLTVTDTSGCISESSHFMSVENICTLGMATAFTPNGDGLNDYFYPLNAFKAININFYVFNKVGQKVFETKSWPEKWDGTFKGEPQSSGTYLWVLKYEDVYGKKNQLSGTVVLIR